MTREQFEQALVPKGTHSIVLSRKNIEQLKEWYPSETIKPEALFPLRYKGMTIRHSDYLQDNIILCCNVDGQVIHATNVEKVDAN